MCFAEPHKPVLVHRGHPGRPLAGAAHVDVAFNLLIIVGVVFAFAPSAHESRLHGIATPVYMR